MIDDYLRQYPLNMILMENKAKLVKYIVMYAKGTKFF